MKFFFAHIFLFFLINCNSYDSPNVIFILTDDQGYGDLGVYGASDILTPNLDKLARDGAYFTSYYATQPVCSASRASIRCWALSRSNFDIRLIRISVNLTTSSSFTTRFK